MMVNYLAWFVVTLTIAPFVHSTPEKPDCEWVPYNEVARMRDLSDCRKFYYCEKGKAPYRASCPTDVSANSYYLYFEPKSQHCDFSWKAPKDCFGTGGGGSGSYVTPTTTTTTTPAPTTTTRRPRPPQLDDDFDFEIDCSKRICGMFPNTYGACDTYVICVNGVKTIKKCNGGQKFDVKTKECQPAPAATCWTEPNAGPYKRRKSQEECPFHGYVPTQPVQNVTNGIVLQNPMVTNWGSWQQWVHCPAGMYATGMYAWRRMLQQGFNLEKHDHAGIVSLSFLCQTPGGSETNFIESLAPGLPHDGWPMYFMCRGGVVGMRLNSVKQNGWIGTGPVRPDQLATDNVQAMCSCSGPAYKPYEQPKYIPQNGNRGQWTAPQHCKKGQAVCGMQTQMQEYKELLVGTYDNNGLNNMKVKCCDVPDPFEKCVPKEEELFVRTCDNSKSDEGLRCDFDATVGPSVDYEPNPKRVDFYSSVGYTFTDKKENISSRIEEKLTEQIRNGVQLRYDWDDVDPSVKGEVVTITPKSMFIQPFEKVELYQIVGKCDYFTIQTNQYVRVIKDGNTGSVKKREYFEV